MNSGFSKTEEIIRKSFEDGTFRRQLMSESLFWFSHFYFPSSFKIPTANFQKEIFEILQSDHKGMIIITAARKAGKSTICCEHYPLFEILARQKKHFVVIISRTEYQAQSHLVNIKNELERPENILLTKDWGPFKEESDEWSKHSLVFPARGAKITALSTGQSIRGMRYLQYRPDLIILDDIEDPDSVSKLEGRNKTYHWINNDIIPAGDDNPRIIFLGTPLHPDSAMRRLEKKIKDGEMDGIFRSYPILDENNNIMWPGRYPDMEAIETEKRKSDPVAWAQEYLLKDVVDEDQIISPERIQFYKSLPERALWTGHKFRIISVDPAMSNKETADCTAIVSAEVYHSGKNMKIFILPNPINKRGMSAKETVECVKRLQDDVIESYGTKVVVENVGSQSILVQMMEDAGIRDVVSFSPGKLDKRTRQVLAASFIEYGQIFFPETGTKDLMNQLINFGCTRYDDLADSYAQLVLKAAELVKSLFVIPGAWYPESSYLPRYLTNKENSEKLLKELEREADIKLIRRSDFERRNQ